MSIDWDIDSYKTEFETDEHWELKKRFMLAHKDKFPEDELVCLAQVFTNIEFMGCRYPPETMKRVAYLAKGLVEDFREKKKNCLKRTFVAASDAASAKAKGLRAHEEVTPKPEPDSGEPKAKKKKIEKTKTKNPKVKPLKKEKKKKNKPESKLGGEHQEGKPMPEPDSGQGKKKKKKSDKPKTKNSHGNPSSKQISEINEPNLNLEAVRIMMLSAITNVIQSFLGQVFVKKSVLDEFVVLYFEKKENPLGIIARSIAANKYQMSWCLNSANSPGEKSVQLYFNGEFISSAQGDNVDRCKRQAAKVALEKLKENCFGIRLNRNYRALGVSNKDFLIRSEMNASNTLGENNIGCKLMVLMGWKGGGLGKEEQGIKEPITLNMLAPREGFGVKSDINSFNKKAENFLRDWINSGSQDDLMFSSDFTTEERKQLHRLAHSFSLNSKSHGKKNNRRLLISKSQHPLEIVGDLIKAGGTTNKFVLVYPKKLVQNPSEGGNN